MTGLLAVVVFTALLPLAGASGEPEPVRVPEDGKAAPGNAHRTAPGNARTDPGNAHRSVPGNSAATVPGNGAESVPGNAPSAAPSRVLPRDASARCGPELSSPEGIEAQTCVLSEAGSTWARTYYRNATGVELRAVLALMGAGDRTVQMHCAVSAEDEPGVCETPREPTRGKAAEYSAVSEFAAAGDGPLLLRSGSNSAAPAPR
ncbi:hypothetical protein AR457_18140 [Streptomyces agglomeratus]|uniref:hypothetical protein n=1 Tax=Streptomyces agglomeratus TaxID=285458 RepID=UPI0008540D18|nr:hypothetical protein [Streptomyces agglomeratus]OEJ39841.1 hypothetical protein BGK70_18515 [Streptomyces agglomeratus]OEJ45780.1 hypothetical protein AR457_18140 [Streptomyces agglomeratus]OEJ59762.1 hypothetical protein BGM19_19040 [Streptomyces agglomeratus]